MARGLGAVVVALVAVAGCGDDGPSSEGLPQVPEAEFEDLTGRTSVDVRALDNVFEPRYVTVSPGTTVTFTNGGRNVHNVLAADEGAFTDIPADAFAPGDKGSITFDTPGTYAYYCSLHGTRDRGMTGRIVVKG